MDQRPSDQCEGFDPFAGKLWIYPNNLTIRPYQRSAVNLALFNNAMIVLPTGFGKTFIAAVVMYNFYRWYPQGKIIFVAPTRPLVAQQIKECKQISGIPSRDCIELTGSIPQERRSAYWSSKRVIFATPQVIQNDLQNQLVPAKQVKCLVIDEAHKAQGGYAYVEIVKILHDQNKNGFRILALSATPGSNIDKVKQVMLNLLISEVMFRREDSLDLLQFRNAKNSKAWMVELGGRHRKVVEKFVNMTKPIFKELYKAGLTFSSDTIERASKFVLLMAKNRLQRNEVQNIGSRKGKLIYYCMSAMSLVHAFELLTIYGVRVFYSCVKRTFEEKKSILRTALAGQIEFDMMMKDIEAWFGEDVEPDQNKVPKCDLLQGHPKLHVVKDLLLKHFKSNEGQKDTRAIIFTKYRESVIDIVQTLKVFEPVIKACPFVGQGTSGGKTGSGMKQREQIQAIDEFKSGKFNVLVATCVAEEGLDIGEVDLIICFDTSVSPISNTQRRGRTGRKRSGDVQTLLTKGYEEKKLNKAGASRRLVEDQLYNRETYIMCRYRDAPRMIPHDINPVCLEQRIFTLNEDEDENEDKPKRKRRKRENVELVEEVDSIKKAKNKRKKLVDDEEEEEVGGKVNTSWVFADEMIQSDHESNDNNGDDDNNEKTFDDNDDCFDDDLSDFGGGQATPQAQTESTTTTTTTSTTTCTSNQTSSIETKNCGESSGANEEDDIEWGSDLEFDCV